MIPIHLRERTYKSLFILWYFLILPIQMNIIPQLDLMGITLFSIFGKILFIEGLFLTFGAFLMAQSFQPEPMIWDLIRWMVLPFGYIFFSQGIVFQGFFSRWGVFLILKSFLFLTEGLVFYGLNIHFFESRKDSFLLTGILSFPLLWGMQKLLGSYESRVKGRIQEI